MFCRKVEVHVMFKPVNADDPDIWTGSPSLPARLAVGVLRGVQTFSKLFNVSFMRTFAPMIANDHPSAWAIRGLSVNIEDFNGWPVYTLRAGSSTTSTVLCVHGGAFTVEATALHWRTYAALARDTGAQVIVPIYPLAPEGTAASVVPQMADLITDLIDRTEAAVGLYGDSAGGTIALAAAQELVMRGTEVPTYMVLVSPLLDATLSNPECLTINDPVLDVSELQEAGRLWAGDLEPTHPMVSPLFGSLLGLPPTSVYMGSLDVLSADVLRLRERAVSENADMTFDLRHGLIHNWAMSSSPEGRAIRPQVYRELTGTD
jgi:triacylglycerol lipase